MGGGQPTPPTPPREEEERDFFPRPLSTRLQLSLHPCLRSRLRRSKREGHRYGRGGGREEDSWRVCERGGEGGGVEAKLIKLAGGRRKRSQRGVFGTAGRRRNEKEGKEAAKNIPLPPFPLSRREETCFLAWRPSLSFSARWFECRTSFQAGRFLPPSLIKSAVAFPHLRNPSLPFSSPLRTCCFLSSLPVRVSRRLTMRRYDVASSSSSHYFLHNAIATAAAAAATRQMPARTYVRSVASPPDPPRGRNHARH